MAPPALHSRDTGATNPRPCPSRLTNTIGSIPYQGCGRGLFGSGIRKARARIVAPSDAHVRKHDSGSRRSESRRTCTSPRRGRGSCFASAMISAGGRRSHCSDGRKRDASCRPRHVAASSARFRPTQQSGRGTRRRSSSWRSRSAAVSSSPSNELPMTASCICRFELATKTCPNLRRSRSTRRRGSETPTVARLLQIVVLDGDAAAGVAASICRRARVTHLLRIRMKPSEQADRAARSREPAVAGWRDRVTRAWPRLSAPCRRRGSALSRGRSRRPSWVRW